MSKDSLAGVLQYLRRIALAGTGQTSDAGLLNRFVRDADELAFEKLVALHGPMVLALCRRLLRHEHDAEDAFQATFLALARKANTISNTESVACWLYKVAFRVASGMRGKVSALTNRMPDLDRPGSESEVEIVWRDLRAVLDQEIARLAERYRRPVVLCYLQGKTNAEAASLLGWPPGTVATRLARAREQLRRQLTQRGWGLSGGLLATLLCDRAAAVSVPQALFRATAKAALAYSSKLAGTGLMSANVINLSEGVLRMLWLDKMKMVMGAVLALAVVGTSIGVVAYQTWAGSEQGEPRQAQEGVPPQKRNQQTLPGEGTKSNIAELRKEIADLRKQIKSLEEALHQSRPPQEAGSRFRGKPLSFWLDQYRDADPKYRADAVEALGYCAKTDKTVIPVLLGALSEEEEDVASKVRLAVSALGSDVAIPRLIELLKDKSSLRGRINACYTLMLRGNAQAAVPVLVETLEEEDWQLRRACVGALGGIGPGAKSALPALVDVLGKSLHAFPSEKDFKALQRGEVSFSFMSPDEVFRMLFLIDRELKMLLPAGIENFGNQLSYKEHLAKWRQAYEILKKKVQSEK